MGVEPFLVASTVEAVMAQRLVRRVCKHCRVAYTPTSEDVPDDFPLDQLDGRPLYRSNGCRECRDVGYRGRMGVYELLVTTENIREMAHERATTWEIKKAAVEEGMVTLRDDGWQHVINGDTTIDEVTRITKSDRLMRS